MFQLTDVLLSALGLAVLVIIFLYLWKWSKDHFRFAFSSLSTFYSTELFAERNRRWLIIEYWLAGLASKLVWCSSGVVVFVVTVINLGLLTDRNERAWRVVVAWAIAGLLSTLVDLFFLWPHKKTMLLAELLDVLSRPSFWRRSFSMIDVYDVAIIGMGAVGTATGFLLAEFTNLHSLLFLEKETGTGQVASDRKTNSQTRHPFGGELNYTPDVMKAIKRYSDMIPSYVNSAYGQGYDILRRTRSGMVLAVGRREKDYLRKKFHDTVKPVFPDAELMEDREEIAKLEPYVVKGRKKDEEIGIIKLQADMVDFGKLAKSFEDNARKHHDKKINVKFNKKVERIEKVSDGYDLYTHNGGSFSARYLVISAGSYTHSLAKQLGLGNDYVALPVAGKFFSSPPVIGGKVYTFQEEGVPFAATHADREWDGTITRYGPTATPTLMFEKGKPDIKELIDNLHPVLLDTVISKKAIRNIMLKNIAYSMPVFGQRLFWKYEARKIVPSLPFRDLKPAPEFGGVRTMAINKRTRELKLGEFTLPEVPKDGENICANMAPSPGASGCLGIAYKNVLKIAKALDLHFDDDKFTKVFGTMPVE